MFLCKKVEIVPELGWLGWFGNAKKKEFENYLKDVWQPKKYLFVKRGVQKNRQYQYKQGLINIHVYTYIRRYSSRL